MKKIKFLLIVSLISLCSGCIFLDFGVYMREKAVLPEHYSYYSPTFQLKGNDLIRTDGVYVRELFSNERYIYQYQRFFPNGQVYLSWNYLSLDSIDFNNIEKNGIRGYYLVQGEKLLIELYSPARRLWIYQDAVVKEDYVKIKYSETKGYSKKYQGEIYTFKEVHKLNTKPFW